MAAPGFCGVEPRVSTKRQQATRRPARIAFMRCSSSSRMEKTVRGSERGIWVWQPLAYLIYPKREGQLAGYRVPLAKRCFSIRRARDTIKDRKAASYQSSQF